MAMSRFDFLLKTLVWRNACYPVKRVVLERYAQRMGFGLPLLLLPQKVHTTAILEKKKGKKHQAKTDLSMSADSSLLNLEEVNREMQTVLENLQKDYVKTISIRTSQGSLDHIIVATNDGKFPLNQLAQISSKTPSIMTVNLMSNPQFTSAAMTALSQSGLNLNPQLDGNIITVPVPKVTKEHREKLAKTAKNMSDKAKVNLRNIRSKFVRDVQNHKNTAPKDTVQKLEKQIQQITDNFNRSVDNVLAAKKDELLGK